MHKFTFDVMNKTEGQEIALFVFENVGIEISRIFVWLSMLIEM